MIDTTYRRFAICRLLFVILGAAVFFNSAVLPLHAGAKMEKPVKIEQKKILDYNDKWKHEYRMYRVDHTFVDTLRSKIGSDMKIDVYLAFWCGDSRVNVPKFIKILDVVRPQNLAVNYYTVKRKPSKDVKYYVKDLKVERVPTFIFYRGGKEIGRIIENPQKNMLEDFLDIIF